MARADSGDTLLQQELTTLLAGGMAIQNGG